MFLASVFLLGAYLSYIRAIAKGEIAHPFVITIWLIWIMLNLITYREVASIQAQIFTWVQFACIIIIALLTVIGTLRKGLEETQRIIKIEGWDFFLGFAVMAAILYKFVVNDPQTSNTVAQLAILLSFVPMVKMACAGTQNMNHWPWVFGVAAYACQFLVAWSGGMPALAFPIVGIMGHTAVWIGIILGRRRSLCHSG